MAASKYMKNYSHIQEELKKSPKVWVVTGVAGFIGSNLLEALLGLNQRVVGLDNFATGHQRNLDEVQQLVTRKQWSNFRFIEGDIRHLADCRDACAGADYILHQAALGSVPRSVEDPIASNAANVTGSLNMLVAARDAGVQNFVYAASSSTYGDHPALPKIEERIGKPLSPYAVTKYVNELYASVFASCYEFNCVGLRYFNVFGARQDPNGAYAAVIPKWIKALLDGASIEINGDGETSRDFCYIENVIQANILAATKENHKGSAEVYNIALGGKTTLNQLFSELRTLCKAEGINYTQEPIYRPFRAADIKHSQADIQKAREGLGYEPTHDVSLGLQRTLKFHLTRGKDAYPLAGQKSP